MSRGFQFPSERHEDGSGWKLISFPGLKCLRCQWQCLGDFSVRYRRMNDRPYGDHQEQKQEDQERRRRKGSPSRLPIVVAPDRGPNDDTSRR